MKYYHFLILIALSVMTLGGCSTEDNVETDAELLPYFQIFADEAAERGFEVDYESERIEGLLQNIPNAEIKGQCFRNVDKPRKVIIDIECWNNSNDSEKEFIIFHELGHCFLDRGHLDTTRPDGNCTSIMHSRVGICPFALTSSNREGYFDELFQK